MRKRQGLIFLMVMAFLVLVSSTVMAYPTLVTDAYNQAYFNNYENIYRIDQTSNQWRLLNITTDTIQEGDIFQGILNIQNIDANGSTVWHSALGDNVSGYFLLEVDTVKPGSLTFASYNGSDPLNILQSNESMALFTDTDTQFTHADYVTDLANATDGNLWLTLGFTDLAYWFSDANADFSPVNGSAIAEGWGGLNVIRNNTSLQFDPIYDFVDSGKIIAQVGSLPLIDFFFSTEIELDAPFPGQSDNGWVFASNDPATFYPTPEPASMLLLGIGLLGVAGLARKKIIIKKL